MSEPAIPVEEGAGLGGRSVSHVSFFVRGVTCRAKKRPRPILAGVPDDRGLSSLKNHVFLTAGTGGAGGASSTGGLTAGGAIDGAVFTAGAGAGAVEGITFEGRVGDD
jgi:hypothetical protein